MLLVARGITVTVMMAGWKKMKDPLGSKGAFTKWALGLLGAGEDRTVEPFSEARLMTAVSRLAVLLLLPATALAAMPGPWSVLAGLTVGSLAQSLLQVPPNMWVKGGTGASLNKAAQTGGPALGVTIGAFALNGTADAMDAAIKQGAGPDVISHLQQTGDLHTALVAPPVVLFGLLWGKLVPKYHIAPLDVLLPALRDVGASIPDMTEIYERLLARGVGTVGTAIDIFLEEPRNSLHERRLAQFDLTGRQLRLLRLALVGLVSEVDEPASLGTKKPVQCSRGGIARSVPRPRPPGSATPRTPPTCNCWTW
jgi:hypothetical protein